MKTQNNRQLFVITSVMCLLPLLLALALYRDLPVKIAVHWDEMGRADTFVPKALAAFGLPILFAGINAYSKLRLYNDPKRQQGQHAQGVEMISTWLIPILSLVLMPLTLFVAMGVAVPVPLITSCGLGFLLIVVGNYLPKCRQNYTIGIKLPWTLQNADNWNKTHRMAGYLWMLGGLLVLAAAFLLANSLPVTLGVVLALVLLPTAYSYCQYRAGGQQSK